ncbi:MAG: NUDIX domain-containing protein [Gammaproteobacteria bacterium]|nr:NUDIX domain-containing protein [Gammaproteobacteria bacterium]MBU1504645.1 NUDIX domain-containing protein [Gammaproteobacteria bacterium]MBU2122644.1 NUDIX domain-containing protein [Gammaproteobacteria bacterium]MBU2172190.1 NUDIX domain-containing protein [Gammaproteobacteria bacterium]MBU2199056.1 NUDIX domain-containing protein [Gammaproteobacteria bacterium]
MTASQPSASFDQWLVGARQLAHQPALQPRQPLVVAGQVVGSVAKGFLRQISLHRLLDKRYQLSIGEHCGAPAWNLDLPPDVGANADGNAITDALNTLAAALRDANLCGPWRNEQLAVTNPQGDVVGTVERGAVRVLGITTCAVHLVSLAPDGRMWVQKRSLNKPNDPGLWDTLMGGMISAVDSLPQALARETWEEAGLHIDALSEVAHRGHVLFSRPSREGGGTGYMVERIDWFSAVVPDGMAPDNQDGEVDEFALLPLEEVRAQVAQGRFTLEAGLVIAGFLGL